MLAPMHTISRGCTRLISAWRALRRELKPSLSPSVRPRWNHECVGSRATMVQRTPAFLAILRKPSGVTPPFSGRPPCGGERGEERSRRQHILRGNELEGGTGSRGLRHHDRHRAPEKSRQGGQASSADTSAVFAGAQGRGHPAGTAWCSVTRAARSVRWTPPSLASPRRSLAFAHAPCGHSRLRTPGSSRHVSRLPPRAECTT